MRKMMMFLAVTILLFGASGQALANFAQGDLIQVVYQSGGSYEVATDLGAFGPTTVYSGLTINSTSNQFPSAGGTGVFQNAGWSNLNVAYFVYTPSAVWTSGPAGGQSSALPSGSLASQSSSPVQDMLNEFASLGAQGQATLLNSQSNSYYQNMDLGGSAVGTFDGFIREGNVEQNLAALLSQSYVDSYLYYYANPADPSAGVQVADIRTFANGTSEYLTPQGAGASPVPVPPSVLLMCSGLVGLLGMRSKLFIKS